MSGTGPRRRRAACLLSLLAAVLLTSPTAAWGLSTAASEPAEVTVEGDTLRVVMSVDDLPAGAELDTSAVSVRVGDEQWRTSAQEVGGRSPVVRRAVLVVDTSGSMGARGIADAQAAAKRYLTVVPADVAVGLVTFSSTAQLAVAPTQDRAKVLTALGQMRATGDTRLYDGISIALQALGTTGERALIVLSDGRDTASTTTLDAVTSRLGASGASVDLVAFRTEGSQVDVLTGLARATKGRVSEASSGAQLADVFARAGENLVRKFVVTATVPEGTPAGAAEAVVELPGASVTTVRFDVPVRPGTADDARGTVAGSRSTVTTAVPWLLPVVLVVCFVGLFLLLLTALSPRTWGKSDSMLRSKEIQRYGLTGVSGVQWTPAEDHVGSASQTALAWADRAVKRRGVDGSWRTALDRAGIPLRPQEWLIIRLAAALATAALAVVMLPWWFVTGPLGALLGWVVAGAYVTLKARRRLRRFADGLPDVLQLVAGSLRSGFSLPQAVDNAAKDGQEPLAGEFARALAESRLGVPLEDAMERVAERMDSTDLAWTVMAIRIAREVGGNLAEVLLSTAETMRERGRIQRQVRVLSAEGRLSAYILIGLPVGISAFMVLFRGDYIAPLVTDPIGWVMTGYGVLSVLVGAWWMSRMIKLEV